MPKISIIVPCFNEAEAVPYFYGAITKQSDIMREKYGVDFEYIFVDDGSKDDTLSIVREYAAKDGRVRYVSFSRNFGKEAAMLAGLESARGDYVSVMDADLQDPPELLCEMYETIVNEGYDCAAARRVTRKGEPKLRSFLSRLFYSLIGKIANADIADGARDYRLMTRKVIDAIISMKEYNRFSKGIFGWVGFKTKWIEFENAERIAGETKWSMWKLFLYSVDGITSFSTMPLAVASVIGMLMCVIAFVMILVIIAKTVIWGDPVAGYPSLVCIIFFVAGVQTFCVGIVGQYLAKTYMEVKNRPAYIIKEEGGAGKE